ncbi:MAG: hypothetical protein WBI82_17145 [Sphaerochaeta sp.]
MTSHGSDIMGIMRIIGTVDWGAFSEYDQFHMVLKFDELGFAEAAFKTTRYDKHDAYTLFLPVPLLS